jgi:hypothetical protein
MSLVFYYLSTNDGPQNVCLGVSRRNKKGWWWSAFQVDIFAFAEGRHFIVWDGGNGMGGTNE